MLFTVNVSFHGGKGSQIRHSLVTDGGIRNEGLFSLAYALNQAEHVEQFTVSQDGHIIMPNDLRFGSMLKWVSKITYYGS